MAAHDCKRSVDMKVVDEHFASIRGDINVAQRAVHAANAVVELFDALKKEGALVEGVDYLAVLRTILKDANGMLTAAGVEWDETELAMGAAHG